MQGKRGNWEGLHNESGKIQEARLPSFSDSFTVSAARAHTNAIIRPIMIPKIPLKDCRYITHNAELTRIILARTCVPGLRVLDMDFPSRMMEAQKSAG